MVCEGPPTFIAVYYVGVLIPKTTHLALAIIQPWSFDMQNKSNVPTSEPGRRKIT